MIVAAILALAAYAAGPAVAAEPLANRLAAETSDYLRSAAASPVAWQPWGTTAFRLARELDRPILLSVGAGWCHWCHVMDRETYADPAIAAFIKVLGGDDRRRVALDTLDFLWSRLRQPDGGIAHAYRHGRGTTSAGFLDDQMAVAAAFLDAFEVTGAVGHLDSARALVAHAVTRFRDADGAFSDTPIGVAEPGVPAEPRKSFVDADRPSGNALAAFVLEWLYGLTNDASYRTLARDTLAAFPLSAHRLGPLAASYAYAADLHLNGAVHVVIAGRATDPRTGALARGALRAFRPGKTVAAYDPETIDPARLPSPVAGVLRQPTAASEPRAYVCTGTLCSLPQLDADALRGLVERLGRRP